MWIYLISEGFTWLKLNPKIVNTEIYSPVEKNFLLNYVINNWTYLFRIQRILLLLPIPVGYWNCWHSWLVTIKSPIYMLKHSLTLSLCFRKSWYLWEIQCFAVGGQTNIQCPLPRANWQSPIEKIHHCPVPLFKFFFKSQISSNYKYYQHLEQRPYTRTLDSFSLSIKTHEFSQQPYRMLHPEIVLEYFGE